MKDLRQAAGGVILCIGDMIYDTQTDSMGFLWKRERKIDIIADDIYVWHVHWFRNKNAPPFFEEEGFKMSIYLGIIELYPANTRSS